VRVTPLELGIALGARDKESLGLVNGKQPGEIQIAPIQQVKSPRLDQQLVEHIDLVGLAVADVDEAKSEEDEEEVDEEFDINSLLAELESEESKESEEGEDDEEDMDEAKKEEDEEEDLDEEYQLFLELKKKYEEKGEDHEEHEKAETKAEEDEEEAEEGSEEGGEDEDGEMNLEALLAELEEGSEEESEEEVDEAKKEEEKEEEEDESMDEIAQLKAQLHETNLLNAKLLYVNKMFKTFQLTESQKINVLKQFDKATTVNETKLVYNTLNESFKQIKGEGKTKNKLQESVGFASKPAGTSTAKKSNDPIVSLDVNRLQFLAGIKTKN
jgi:hypothetical protein